MNNFQKFNDKHEELERLSLFVALRMSNSWKGSSDTLFKLEVE